MNLEHTLHDGSPRPGWAGPVRITSRGQAATRGDGRIVQLSGLVLPVAMAQRRPSSTPTFGASLGFPNLRDHLGAASPELWNHWHRLEHMVAEAAEATMGWRASRSTLATTHARVPEHALHLEVRRQPPVSSDRKRGAALEAVEGAIHKVFAIRSATGDRVRFESAGASAPFRITSSSASWSRDPRSL